MTQQTRTPTSDIPSGIFRNGNDGIGAHGRTGALPAGVFLTGNDGVGAHGRTGALPANVFLTGNDGTGSRGRTGAVPDKLDYAAGLADGLAAAGAAIGVPASASDLAGRVLPGGVLELSWAYPDDLAAQGVAFDVYCSASPMTVFRSAVALSAAGRSVQLPTANLPADSFFSVVARRGNAMALPSSLARVAVPPLAASTTAPTAVSAARSSVPTGVGFPFGISPAGGVFAQGGDDLLRGKILQLLLTSPGERVNRPDYGTRLLDLVFDPNSEVLAATMEFTITRALQQAFADDIQLDSVQITSDDDTLLVDISYLRKADLTLEQIRIGVPLPPGASS